VGEFICTEGKGVPFQVASVSYKSYTTQPGNTYIEIEVTPFFNGRTPANFDPDTGSYKETT
jgi:hypothetical protein